MTIAVMSDIHGNYIAFQKCIDYALERGADTFFFLGDYSGELAYPQRTMEILYSMKERYHCYFIKGNKEEYWLNYRKNGETGWKEKDSTTGSLLYTYNELTEADFAFYESLSYVQEIVFEGLPAMTICHGSPRKANEKMLPGDARTFEIMEKAQTSLILCGHTHVQGKIQLDDKCVLNPGSVGVPLYSDGKTQFMILHQKENGWQEEFISLSYDVERVIRELREAGLDEKAPYWCRVSERLLREGDVSHGEVLERAMKLCYEDTGACVWPEIPEKYWEQAVRESFAT